MNKNKILTGMAIVVGALIAAMALQKTDLLKKEKKMTPLSKSSRDNRMRVKTQTVNTIKHGSRISTVGTILANEGVEVRSEISGIIEKIYFMEGTAIRKGDILFSINDNELQARLLSARYRLALAEQQEERQRVFVEKGHVSREEYENTAANLNVIKAEVQLIKAQLDKTEIRAPFNGRVGLRYVSEGSYVTPSTPVTTLQDTGVLKIEFTVPGKYAGKIISGETVTFEAQGTQQTLSARIYAMQPNVDLSTRMLSIRAITSNSYGTLFPGTHATVNISIKEKETIMIPSFALIPEFKEHKVFLLKDGKAEEFRVGIGPRTHDMVEITNGIKPGDTLITSGILQLRHGMPVETEQKGSEKTPAGSGMEQGL